MAEPDSLASVVERELFGAPSLSARQIAEKTGMDLDTLAAVRRALGLSIADDDEVAYDDIDLQAARGAKSLLDAGVPREVLVDSTRVLGHGMALWAATVRDLWVESFAPPDEDPAETAERLVQMAQAFLPEGTRQLDYAFRMHLRDVLRHDAAEIDTRAPGGGRSVKVTVGFADIVGFTELGERLEEGEMGAIADRLAERAGELAVSPVRLVKTLGDGVLLVSSRPQPLVDALLELVADPEGPPVRAGAAVGPALHRLGDYYGHTVNLASRVAGRARPDSLLVTEEVADALGDGYQLSPTPPKDLKGIGLVNLVRVRALTGT